jgi:ATP-dependent DNA ligase
VAKADGGGQFALPLATEPMEARTAEVLPHDADRWQYEPKWDGFRCLAYKEGTAVELRGRSGKPLGRYFSEMLEALAAVPANRFVLDGELVIGPAGEAAFDALQMRLHPAESRIRRLARETPAELILFDMLADPAGTVLMAEPMAKRREALEALVKALRRLPRLRLSPATVDVDAAERWLAEAGHGSTDGAVAKRRDAPYTPGERSMIKVKHLRTADCVVGGFRYQAGAPLVGSLLLGLYDAAGRLDHVGFTSTITNAERPELTRRLETLEAPPGFTGRAPGGPSRWSTDRTGEWKPLRPDLVVEVRYDPVTGDRFRHGTRLLRWRPDKAPRQCTMDQLAPPINAAGLRGA